MKISYQIVIATALFASASFPASAAESATLRNGFAIRLERHEVRGSVTRFYLSRTSDDYLDVPTAEILTFEEEEIVSTVPPAPAPNPATVNTLDEVVSAASSHNNIDRDLIPSVIRAESGFNPRAASPTRAPVVQWGETSGILTARRPPSADRKPTFPTTAQRARIPKPPHPAQPA